jgi:hypothetical protein
LERVHPRERQHEGSRRRGDAAGAVPPLPLFQKNTARAGVGLTVGWWRSAPPAPPNLLGTREDRQVSELRERPDRIHIVLIQQAVGL